MRAQTETEAVIFDFDGTLVHLNIDFDRMRREVEDALARYGIEPAGLTGLYILEMIDEATVILSNRSPLDGPSFYSNAYEVVTGQEVRAAKEGNLFPGVIPMLEQLGRKGVKVGIVTRNCSKAVKTVFPQIERFCDVFVPRDDVSRVKPHPDHLALALKKLRVNNPLTCFMVGDHILDIEAGKRLGMKTAGVLTGKTSYGDFLKAGAGVILDNATKIPACIFKGSAE